MRTKQLIRSQPFDRLEPRMLLSTVATTPVAAQLQSAIQFAQAQLTTTATTDLANNPADYIDYTKANGTWDVTNAGSWSAGAWPAELWELYDLTGNANWKAEAQSWSTNLVSQDAQTSDDYLRIYDPFIYAYDDSASAQAASAITTAAMSRVSTFNAAVGAWSEPWRSSSSGNPAANFGVLLDQTMDTQEVFWAAAYTGNTTLYNDAVAEMTTAEKYLVRSDGSTAQFAYFNAGTGAFIDQETYAGYSAASTWSRGQAWAINSFANAYQQTHRADFLATAESLANYYIAHVPSDGVPYWDYDDPSIPNANRDTSAAAIAATGLLQLAQVDPTAANAQKYYHQAETILGSLCSTYLATGTTSHGILLEGDDLNFGVNDASLVWGDFYFLKAADLYLNRSLTSLSITPAAPTLSAGGTQTFVAAGLDQYGNALPSPPVTWSASAGTITAAGLYTAPSQAGTYTVTAATGSITASDTIHVSGAGSTVGGTVAGAAAGETIYLDANNNGILDSSELTTVTSSTGSYSFAAVPSGAYIIRQILPAGYLQTSPANNYGIHITLTGGTQLSNQNFVDTIAASGGNISGAVVGGAAGEIVYLDANNNGALDAGELSTTTAASGTYSFSHVPPGAYVVRQQLVAGYAQLAPANGFGIHLTVANGSLFNNQNFTDAAPTASIAGTVFNDANANGKDDNGETGLGEWTVYLDLSNSGVYAAGDPTSTTDTDGNYLFANLAAGAYIVRAERPTGYSQTTPTNNFGQHVTLNAAQMISGLLFGEHAIG